MMVFIALLIALLNPLSALATILVYDPLLVSNCTSGNYSAEAHDCSGVIGENGYNNHQTAINALVPGDTYRMRGGTHNIQLDFQLGNKTGTAGAYITVESYPGETAILKYSDASDNSYGAVKARGNRGYFIFQDFKIDGANLGTRTGWSLRDGNHHFIIRRVEIYGQDSNGLYIDASDVTVESVILHDARSDCVPGKRWYGFYLHDGARVTITAPHVYNMPGGGGLVYPGPLSNVSLTDGDIHGNSTCTTTDVGGLVVGPDSTGGNFSNITIANTRIYGNGPGGTGGNGGGIRFIRGTFTFTGLKANNNTIYNNQANSGTAYGMNIASGVTGEAKNNLVVANETGQINDGSGGSMTLANNRATGTITDCTVSTSDFTLKSGTNPCVDGGTAVTTRTCNGTCDIGAYESFGFSSGVVAGTTAEVTLGMSLNTPVILSTPGWSLTCTPAPTACPSPTVTAVTLKSGTNTTASVLWSGGACSSGQTWKVSYNPSAGASTETGLILPYQELNTITDQTLTNDCTGGGGGPPAGTPFLLYEFDDNLSDTSGNNLHITTSNGTSFVDAKHFRGLKTDSGQDDYAEMPYFSGVNPSTQSLTIAGGVYIDPADVCSLKAVGGTPAGVSQYFHLYYSSCTWKMLIQDSTIAATEFSVQSGWNHVCVNFNSTTDTAVLHINGVAGASSGSSSQTYTSFVFAGNFRLGRFSGSSLASGPNHIYDRWVVYQSVEDCGTLYENFEPPSAPWTGILQATFGQIYMAKSYAGSPIQLAPLGSFATLPEGAAFAIAYQTYCTNAGDCSPIGQRPYYTCTQCPSAGSELPVPDSASADGIEFWGTANEVGLLTGAHGANLSGVLTHVNGGTHLTASSVNVIDLCQNCNTVERWIFRIRPGAPANAQYCIFPKEQSGVALDSYSAPSEGMCVTVGQANANAGP
jgi:hypothetical protein